MEAAKDIGEPYNPNDHYNLGPKGMFGPKGPFGPKGAFGPQNPFYFPSEGSGGIGDKGRWGPNGKPKEVIGGDFGDSYPYGKGSKYPAAWGKVQIDPIHGILDGVPEDVDIEWPKHWKGM